jgi:hypothetical protein
VKKMKIASLSGGGWQGAPKLFYLRHGWTKKKLSNGGYPTEFTIAKRVKIKIKIFKQIVDNAPNIEPNVLSDFYHPNIHDKTHFYDFGKFIVFWARYLLDEYDLS